MMNMPGLPPVSHPSPRLVITEQPRQRGMRFRYLCEGRSAGSIPGEHTSIERKTWPTVQVQNYQGEVTIRVSLVSSDNPPRPHPHSLVGKDCSEGICTVRVSPETQMTATFSNLGIQCVKRKEVADALEARRRLQVDPFNVSQNSDPQTVDIDLNVVSLCFEAFINQGNYHYVIPPVVSNLVYDKKATSSSLLRICRVDRSFGSCKGGDEVYLLCDKVQKDDINICFYEVNTGWEAFGEFSQTDVHRQVAIVFRTPAYKDQNIDRATKVLFQLRRSSDNETSESKEFTYLPLHHAQPTLSGISASKRSHDETKVHLNYHIKSKVQKMDQTSHSKMQREYPDLSRASYPGMQSMPFPTFNFDSNYLPRNTEPTNLIWPPRQIIPPQQYSHLSMNPQPTQSYSQMMVSNPPPQPLYQPAPSYPVQSQAVLPDLTYDATDSTASFSGIDTEGLNESIKQLSLDPIDGPAIKTEIDPQNAFPTPRNPSEDLSNIMPFTAEPPPYSQSPMLNIQAPSPFSQVQSPPMVPSPFSQVQSPAGAYSQVQSPDGNHLNPNQNINPNISSGLSDIFSNDERLPSFDLNRDDFPNGT